LDQRLVHTILEFDNNLLLFNNLPSYLNTGK